MSKIETMRRSGSSAPQLQALQSVADLQKMIEHLDPAQIEKSTQAIQETAGIFGELMAQELATSSQALAQMTLSAQDVASDLNTAIGKVDEQLTRSITTLKQAAQVLKQLQAPKPVVKDHRPTVIIVLQALILLGMSAALVKYLLA